MEVGRQLFEARQRQNLTLVDISRTTKIPVHLLEAIERDDVDHLPQGFFTRAFVRAYAKEVGVDADSLVDSIEESEVEQVPMDLPTVKVPIEEHTSSRSFVAAIGLCAACTTYSGFAWKTVAPATPQVAVANAAQPLHVAAVNAVASPPCVAVPPPASAVPATRRIPPSAVSQDVVTVGTAAPPAVNHVTADDKASMSTPAVESSATTSEPAPAPADQNPTSVPAQQF
jgi:cytoskeleton protein RodZ